MSVPMAWRLARVSLAVFALAAIGLTIARPELVSSAFASAESPYRVEEILVERGPGLRSQPIISANRVLWWESEPSTFTGHVRGQDITSGQPIDLANLGAIEWPADVDGDWLVAGESRPDGSRAIVAYHLPDGARTIVAQSAGGPDARLGAARISGDVVAWLGGTSSVANVFTYNLKTGNRARLTSQAAPRESLALAGDKVVWLDRRDARPFQWEMDIYGVDLASGREFRVTTQPEPINGLAISGNTVVWVSHRGGTPRVESHDLASGASRTIASLSPDSGSIAGVDLDGDLVVWSARGDFDVDVFGYDLERQTSFVVSRAIGAQSDPRVSGRTIVWSDNRHSGLGRYTGQSAIYGARLAPGPAPMPPFVGAPDSADARIQIVWPGGLPVEQADRANIAAWLFLPGTLDLAPCQWSPRVQLWQGRNNEPARPIAAGVKSSGHYFVNSQPIPTWEFNAVDVAAARDPNNRLYFFLTLDGIPSRTNVWAHAIDARTYFPTPDVPTGIAASPGAVDARIQIVWPHDGARVDLASQVNVTASLFHPNTLFSVPPDWSPRVHLYRSLNNGVAESVAVGQKRLVPGPGFSYPVWDFNDVAVGAAANPLNKYYFTLVVEGVQTFTNVWAHGADARTYFPIMDTPTTPCQ
jgi:hypothetical protein